MHDNKVRLSHDVLEKAERIAAEWGLKNARAAVEAVFRRYCDDYLYGRPVNLGGPSPAAQERASTPARGISATAPLTPPRAIAPLVPPGPALQCEALDALDQLLAL